MPKKVSTLPSNVRRSTDAKIRSKITKLLKEQQGFLRGSLSERQRTCGKASCRCARGEKHAGLYLVQSRNGKIKQQFIAAEWADDVRQWVTNYQILQQLLEELSESWWQNVKNREL